MNNNLHLSYRIDEAGDIIFVSDAWAAFGLANDAPEMVNDINFIPVKFLRKPAAKKAN